MVMITQSAALVGKIVSAGCLSGKMNVGGVGAGESNTYLLVDDAGNEVPAVVVDEITAFTATENDIRQGMVAATDSGVTVGTKEIPPYLAHQGSKAVMAGKAFTINGTNYDYDKLQAIICLYNSNMANSVAANMVVINNNVYAVQSVDSLAAVTKDDAAKAIVLNIINNTNKPQILRYLYLREND